MHTEKQVIGEKAEEKKLSQITQNEFGWNEAMGERLEMIAEGRITRNNIACLRRDGFPSPDLQYIRILANTPLIPL